MLSTAKRENRKTFSILCPSRKRPESLRRLIDSIISTTHSLDSIELLVYVDEDDFLTQPGNFANHSFVNFFRGPRLWMSLAQNVLFAQSSGSIIMACADDFVFKSHDWDVKVKEVFESKEDNFWLVYGNDLGKHAGKISTHFFLHRDWPSKVGYWVIPGRASLWDLWVYEIATKLDRTIYLEAIQFEHLNFRQSSSNSVFVDETTREITDLHASFRPKDTYRLLKRERRNDLIILAEAINASVPFEFRYLLGGIVEQIFNRGNNLTAKKRFQSLSNKELVLALIKKIPRLLK